MPIMSEATKLTKLLAKNNIPYEISTFRLGDFPAIKIACPSEAECVVDAVCHPFSYGGKEGYLEVLGSCNPHMENDDVVGWLTAEEAFQYFNGTYVENFNG